MRPICAFSISPSLPPGLERLRELAYNLWWSWNMEGIDLFRRLDRDLWEHTGHNPVLMLGAIDQRKLERAADDEAFLAHMDRVLESFDLYMNGMSTWYRQQHGSGEPIDGTSIAYFSAEFGLTDCIPNYSGGLGVLSGDYLKSGSDLGLPLVGVGLLYQQGYFRQYLSADGWQQERYPVNDFYTMPLQRETNQDGTPVVVELTYPGHRVQAQVWRVQVGRVPLYLLDTNLDSNAPEDRDITDKLYGGDQDMRIRQEIVLGIGGMRALQLMGVRPVVAHMNEGHSAFLGLECIRRLIQEHSISFAEAREAAAASHVFTVHTPVPAGFDIFPPELMDRYFADYYPLLGLSRDEFLALGRSDPSQGGEGFSMAILAMRLSCHVNGVSALHGKVSRRMWQNLWPGVPMDEIPIGSTTNGIHLLSWISHDMSDLYDRYLGPGWREDTVDPDVWKRVDQIPDEELWRTHERRRERLVHFARARLQVQLRRQGAAPASIREATSVLNPGALTIGFARRFATYKRATLIMRDVERLARILNNEKRPVQIIYAGKAHPKDQPAKELIREIVRLTRRDEFRRHIVFIEDYDMNVARYMLQGVDLWLNTPRRTQEASGTSGMKAAANGVINMSVLDGWWDEAYQPGIGWAIGLGEVYEDYEYQDEVESRVIYDLLEKDAIRIFYARDLDGLPREWIRGMKASVQTICPQFNTDRMAREYAEQAYMPASRRHMCLSEEGLMRAKALAEWKAKLRQNWSQIKVLRVQPDAPRDIKVGSEMRFEALVHLGSLGPQDVAVELYHGPLDTRGEIVRGEITEMEHVEHKDNGEHLFVGKMTCRLSGRYGFSLRLLPRHEDLCNRYEPRLILWADSCN